MVGTDNELTAGDRDIQLPNGTLLAGHSPVVIIGPNGSGKTRKAREIIATPAPEFINALRNTRILPSLQVMSYTDAESNFTNQRNQGKSNHWDWTTEFDSLLASLLAQHATNAIKFMDATNAGETPEPSRDPFQRIRDLWHEVFPGRTLTIEDYRPVITSTIFGDPVEYSAQTMSDGERAAIYLAGRVLRAEPGILVVDEPETHLHSLLAARLWDELEAVRPDVRFVYITHDLMFARTRRGATYVLASPVEGLRTMSLAEPLPDDIAEVLLGAASLSFYARRVVLCEGDAENRDAAFYEVWFNDRDTVVRAVGSSDMVHRCMSTLGGGWLVGNVEALGMIDRDFHADAYLDALPAGVTPLAYHEVESLYCLPDVVAAVAAYLKRQFDPAEYLDRLRLGVTGVERQKVVLERWKRRVEPQLVGVVASVHSRTDSLEDIVASLPTTFAEPSWDFSPAELLQEEKARVEAAASVGNVDEFLRVMPGKGRLATAAHYVGEQADNFVNLVNESLRGDGSAESLGGKLEEALAGVLPPRAVPR